MSSSAAYHHTEACQQLGVSASTLRRMAQFYEQAFGALPTDARGGRVYPDEAIKRMIVARELVDGGKAATLERAFEVLANPDADPDDLLTQMHTPEPLELLLIELKGIRLALGDMQEEMGELRKENAELKEQLKVLEPPKEEAAESKEAETHPWWRFWRKD